MALAAGLPSAISLINMDRGFVAEGLLVAALKAAIPDRVIATAPLYVPRYTDPVTHQVYTGHPDALVLADDGQAELIQFKCPSMRKFEHISKFGDESALETYMGQMVTEMFIARNDQKLVMVNGGVTLGGGQYPIPVRNNLGVFCWEHTGKDVRPKLHVVPLDWDDTMATIPLTVGDEVEQEAADALVNDRWPEAYPEHTYNLWPCAYCPYSRLGDYTADPPIPKCDDHETWKPK